MSKDLTGNGTLPQKGAQVVADSFAFYPQAISMSRFHGTRGGACPEGSSLHHGSCGGILGRDHWRQHCDSSGFSCDSLLVFAAYCDGGSGGSIISFLATLHNEPLWELLQLSFANVKQPATV